MGIFRFNLLFTPTSFFSELWSPNKRTASFSIFKMRMRYPHPIVVYDSLLRLWLRLCTSLPPSLSSSSSSFSLPYCRIYLITGYLLWTFIPSSAQVLAFGSSLLGFSFIVLNKQFWLNTYVFCVLSCHQ